MSSSIRIAISGGGVTGAILLHALVKFSHLDVHAFNPAATFEKKGGTVGVANNGMAALDLINTLIVKDLKDAGSISMQVAKLLLGQGPNQGKEVFDYIAKDPKKGVITVAQNPPFIQRLLADLPQGHIHTSKELSKVDRKADDGSLILYFTDETTHECDILIGADDIQSTVRKFVLSENDPTALPKNTGYWLIQGIKPYKDAQVSLGKSIINVDNLRQYGWIGSDTFLMNNTLSEEQGVVFTLCAYEKGAESSDRWSRDVQADEIRKAFQQGMPYLSNSVDELFCNEPKQQAKYMWEHSDAPSYVSGPICILGDAAHSMTGWQGASLGQNFEDILILSTLLGRAKSSTESLVALKVYNRIRRPRTQAVARSSRETGEIMSGRNKEIGLDMEALKKTMDSRWDFIVDFDVEKHRDQAVEMMEVELKK